VGYLPREAWLVEVDSGQTEDRSTQIGVNEVNPENWELGPDSVRYLLRRWRVFGGGR